MVVKVPLAALVWLPITDSSAIVAHYLLLKCIPNEAAGYGSLIGLLVSLDCHRRSRMPLKPVAASYHKEQVLGCIQNEYLSYTLMLVAPLFWVFGFIFSN